MSETQSGFGDRLTAFQAWAHRVGLSRKLAIVLVVASVVSGVATYLSLTAGQPIGSNPRVVLTLLLVNFVLLLSLSALIVRRLVKLWVERRRGSAGSRLHGRMIGMFGLIAVAPAVIVAIFAALFFDFGLQSWLSERVRTAVSTSVAVAEAYLSEHRKVIRADALAMANDLRRAAPLYYRSQARFNQVVEAQAAMRALPEAIVFDRSGIVARSPLSYTLEPDDIPPDALDRAERGEFVVLDSDADDRVRALVRLDLASELYLLVGRAVDPRVIAHIERNKRAVAAYERLERERSSIEITFVLIFIVITLLLLSAAVWMGLSFATRLVTPISLLIGAADQVRAGNLAVQLPEGREDDEIGSLVRAFNRMIGQLHSQRAELMEANRQLDVRRRFTEAVLAGVSAGVLGLDADGRVNLPNRSAATLLGLDTVDLIGRPLAEAAPQMAPLLAEVKARPDRFVQGQVTIDLGGRPRHLLVRIAAEDADGKPLGFVATFDDITDLVAAQRAAAWADVARRIAHEIKNPLTPIRLSAERLKRRYLREIESDPDTFSQCTDTIIRHVLDIGRMVDEFSAFARMPAPVFKTEDLVELAKRALVLHRLAHPDIEFVDDLPEEPVAVRCDARQVGQVLTNLLQNACDAMAGLPEGAPRRVEMGLAVNERNVTLTLADTGPGFPKAQRERLLEPYVTTREKGTGLGLAIVKKIVDDHGAAIVLGDRPEGGALVRLMFARPSEDASEAEEAMKATGTGS